MGWGHCDDTSGPLPVASLSLDNQERRNLHLQSPLGGPGAGTRHLLNGKGWNGTGWSSVTTSKANPAPKAPSPDGKPQGSILQWGVDGCKRVPGTPRITGASSRTARSRGNGRGECGFTQDQAFKRLLALRISLGSRPPAPLAHAPRRGFGMGQSSRLGACRG